MIAVSEGILEAQSLVLRMLGACGGSLNLADPGLRCALGEPLTAAVRALEEAGLAALGRDAVVRPGARGSVLDGTAIEAALAGVPLGHPVEVLASTSSTNELVLERASLGAVPGLVIVAERQTAGRGRRGRGFSCAPGLGLWSTTLLSSPSDPERAPRLSLIAALAVASAVESETGVKPGVKWPNDVRIDGRKLAGILVEARSQGADLFLVAGIGVNVHHRPEEFPPEIRALAGSVEGATGARVERSRLLVRILRELSELLESDRSGLLDLPERFARFDEMRERPVTVETEGRLWRGLAAGIERDGSLLLALESGGTRAFRSGEASLRAREDR